jgi:D-xylose transport system permease protein
MSTPPSVTGAGLSGAVWQRMRGRNSLLPIVAALAGIWLILGAVNPAFLAPENLVNLTLQSAPVGVIALGVVLVLLVGQIDLSVGSLSGLAAAVVAVGSVTLGWPVALAILAALACGVVVGLGYGALSTRLGLPGPLGSINLPFESWFVRSVQQGFLPSGVAWALVGVTVVASAVLQVAARARRRRADLACASVPQIVVRTFVLAAVLSAIVAYLYAGTARGIGWSVLLFALLVVVTDVLLRRTRWGRSVRAVGGDRRAAMLAGVPVRRTVVLCFVACSTLAALGGVLAAGRLGAANQGTGGADTYLVAIAAAVIGGTSLFGGRGSAWSAVLGVLVIQSIANGLTLMNVDQAARYMVTGAVLLLAIIIDMLLRKRREA